MVLLLDTHVVLWWESASPRLGPAARAVISGTDVVYVSAVSAWEAELKRGMGKLVFSGNFSDIVSGNGFTELQLNIAHATAARTLAMHNRDPFDRMLIAQASVEECTMLTADSAFGAYGVPLLDATR